MSEQTRIYINELQKLKPGDLGLLRTHAGQGLDESVNGFDLFAGIWWALRQKSAGAPRREVAWLVAKLHAACPLEYRDGEEFHIARQLARCAPSEDKDRKRYIHRFDKLLRTPIRKLEPEFAWALNQLRDRNLSLDWVALTDSVSQWEQQRIRYEWAKEFTTNLRGVSHAD